MIVKEKKARSKYALANYQSSLNKHFQSSDSGYVRCDGCVPIGLVNVCKLKLEYLMPMNKTQQKEM